MKRSKKELPFFLVGLLIILAGCTGFNGIRKPMYDGRPIVPNDESISAYQASREIIGEEKDYYFRYPFSEEIIEPSLAYPNEDPVLLSEGEYTIGSDLPAGRATLIGNESVFTGDNYEVHAGNFIIRDEAGDVYFENLFHTDYGQSVAQVDLISGHVIEIIGADPEVTVFYEPELPENPYVLMDPPQLLVNLDNLTTQQPLVVNENEQSVQLTAGIYEVGEHLSAGTYEVSEIMANHNTELFLFREGAEPRVFELLVNTRSGEEVAEEVETFFIELQTGDKIYPNLIESLKMTRNSEE